MLQQSTRRPARAAACTVTSGAAPIAPKKIHAAMARPCDRDIIAQQITASKVKDWHLQSND
ncbi:MAG: hypothetical protein ABW200_17180 [Hyphomicrobiaceae bacterium]|jgi:hypothetical protein